MVSILLRIFPPRNFNQCSSFHSAVPMGPPKLCGFRHGFLAAVERLYGSKHGWRTVSAWSIMGPGWSQRPKQHWGALKPRNGRVFYDREMFILLHIVIYWHMSLLCTYIHTMYLSSEKIVNLHTSINGCSCLSNPSLQRSCRTPWLIHLSPASRLAKDLLKLPPAIMICCAGQRSPHCLIESSWADEIRWRLQQWRSKMGHQYGATRFEMFSINMNETMQFWTSFWIRTIKKTLLAEYLAINRHVATPSKIEK